MSIVYLLLSLILNISNNNIALSSFLTEADENAKCITVDKILRPVKTWSVIKREFKYINKELKLEIEVHNPLNTKTENSVDAKFILQAETPFDMERAKLESAIFYKKNVNVVFKRIHTIQKAVFRDRKKIKKQEIDLVTPCFSRAIVSIFEPITVELHGNGGKK